MQRGNSMFYVHASMSTSRNGMLQLILISNRDCEMTGFFFIEYKSEYLRSINPLYESVDDYVCIAEKYVYMTNVTNAICGILGLTTHHICSYFWYTRQHFQCKSLDVLKNTETFKKKTIV